MQAFLNGRFLPQEKARLPLHDAGFVFGATVTDLCRTFRHRLYRLPDHVARFRRSCELARIPQPMPDQELTAMADELTSKNASFLRPEQDLALVMFATPGPIGYYAGLKGGPGEGQPTLGMHTFPLPLERYAGFFREGAHLVIPATRQLPSSCVDSRVKQRSRLHWWIASQEAQQAEKDALALLLDTNGFATETALANFLIVRDGIVVSPPRTHILSGISLLTLEEICGEMGIPFQERPLSVKDCLEADEALLAGTSFCIAGVSQINGQSIPWPGKRYERLLACWNQRVGMDIRGQILSGG